MSDLRTAAQQALEALERCVSTCFDRYAHEQVMSRPEHFVNQSLTALKAALAEPVLERNFCPRCGKRSFPDTIHTCTPPHGIGEQK